MISKQVLLSLIKNPLISGSSIMLAGSFMGNILNYFFILVIGRNLLPSDYGIYSVLSSITILFAIFQSSFSTAFSKFSAKYSAKNDKDGLTAIFFSGLKIIAIFSAVLLFLLIVTINFASSFLHIHYLSYLMFAYIGIIFLISSSLPFGILQGELKFIPLAIFNFIGAFFKIIIGVVLLFLGFKLGGILFALMLSFFIPFAYLIIVVFNDIKTHTSKVVSETQYLTDFKKHSLQFFLATFGITFISTGDVILAKHYFDPVLAGQYAALSIMGKAIFYLTAPVYYVFFPLLAQKKEKGEKLIGTLILGICMVGIFSLLISLVYFLFPNLILKIFFPSPAYKVLLPYLGVYSVFIVIYSLSMLFHNYLLSIGKTGIYKINLLVTIIFILGVYFLHKNIIDIIINLLLSSVLLLLCYWLYVLLPKIRFKKLSY